MSVASPPEPPTESATAVAPGRLTGDTKWRRLVLGQTAIDFWGRRRIWLAISLVLLAITAVTLGFRQLVLGIDFAGGVAWDAPAGQLTTAGAEAILEENGLSATSAKIQERTSESGDVIKIQVEDQTDQVRTQLQEAFATAAGVDANDVGVESVSASWGEEITRKAIIALVVFLGLIALYISLRFEWRMALTAILAMVHDVGISVGIYSLFAFEVTPATVVAFLTVLGYSLYDSIVVFDRIKENERRLAASGLTAGDLINVSTNQVLLRSVNTTIAAALPVFALLVVGAWLFGQVTLREFAIALLVGMLTGAYSSLFVSAPLLGWLKRRTPQFTAAERSGREHLTGDALRAVVISGPGGARGGSGRRRRTIAAPIDRPADRALDDSPAPDDDKALATPVAPAARTVTAAPASQLLSHPPRPRKKKRR
ncbi:MAG: protein translocase subunit SecF [Ilumatobacteraceae bacterium]